VTPATVNKIRADVDAVVARFDAAYADHLASDNGTREYDLRAEADALDLALDRLDQVDPDAGAEYDRYRDKAGVARALAGGPAQCRITQQPRHPLTDTGNAERYAEDHADHLRYVPGLGWHAWDGTRWKPDEDGAAERAAKRTARLIRDEARELDDGDLADKVFGWAIKSESDRALTALVRRARHEAELVVNATALDADPYRLNVVNGTIDLRDGERWVHNRDDLITKRAPVAHDPLAQCPRWRDAIATWTDGDNELAALLQRAVGYSLTGDTREQVLFLLIGDGANGKSTFVETVHHLLGDYATRADATSFTTGHKRGIRSDLARLRGARFVPAVEIEGNARLAASLIKQVTGGDTIVASHLYANEFEYRPQFKLWLAANELPDPRDDSHAMWRRLRVIPFTKRIQRPDRALPERLRDEVAGILNWAIEGCLDWQRDGLPNPQRVQQATDAHRAATDPLAGFLEERCILDPARRTSTTGLWNAYREWADATGEPNALSQKGLGSRLAALGLHAGRDRNGRWWDGIGLRGDA
jgi:putative DNA primase/helicase